MIPILRKEFASKRTSLIVYCLVIIGLTWMYVALFPTIQAQSESLTKTLRSMGPALKAFGIDQISFNTLERFLSIELFGTTWPLLAITFAMARAGAALSGEIEKGTMSILLSQPVKRTGIYLGQYLSGLLAILAFVYITIFAAIPIAAIYNIGFHAQNFAILAVLSLLFVWAIYSLSMLFSAMLNEKGKVYLSTGGLLVLMYVANIVAGLNNKLDWLKYSSLFHYFSASSALASNSVEGISYVVLGGIIIGSTLAGLWWFNRRDMAV